MLLHFDVIFYCGRLMHLHSRPDLLIIIIGSGYIMSRTQLALSCIVTFCERFKYIIHCYESLLVAP